MMIFLSRLQTLGIVPFLIFLVALFSFAKSSVELPKESLILQKGSQPCGNETAPTILTTAKGLINFKSQNTLPANQTCYWKFNLNSTQLQKVLFIELRSINLGAGDELTLTTESNEKFSFEKRTTGSYVLPIESLNNAIVRFSLASEKPLTLGLFYNAESVSFPISTPTFGNYWIYVFGNASIKVPDTIKFELQNSNSPAKTYLISTEKLSLADKTEAVLNGVDLVKSTNDLFVDASKFEFVLNSFKSDKTSQILFSFDQVDSECSGYKQLNGTNNTVLKTISGDLNFSKESYRCLWILETSLDKIFFLNELRVNSSFPQDSLQLRDGGNKTSPLLSYLSPPSSFNLNDNLPLLSKLISSGNKLHILYNSPSTLTSDSKYVPNELSLQITNQVKRFTTSKSQSVSLIPSLEQSNAILFESDPNDRVLFQLKQAFSSANFGAKFFDTFQIDSKPFLSIQANTAWPTEIRSNTNQMVVLFNVTATNKDQLAIVLQGISDPCSLTVSSPSVYLISDSSDILGKRCTFMFHDFLKASSKKHVFSLKITHLLLPTKDDCLSLQVIGADPKELVFKKCGSNPSNESLNTIPNILLDSSKMYNLYYDRSKAAASESTLLQATFEYAPNYVVKDHFLADGSVENFTLPNFPNSYPLVFNSSISHFINTTKLLYMSFNSFDLAEGDTLSVYENKRGGYLANFTGHSLPNRDFIINERVLLLMTAGPMQKRLDNNEWFAGGYSSKIETLECGGMINGTLLQSSNYPDPLKEVKKGCVWIVDASLSSQINWMNFTVEYGKDGEEGLLKVYDSPNKRRALFANMTGTGPYNVSVSTVIIEYSVKGKAPLKGIKLNFERHSCNSTCDNKQRCLTEWNVCDGVNQCSDYTDEMHCNTTFPIPAPEYIKTGLSGWVIVLFIIPISIAIGVICAWYGPQYVNRLRGRQYQEFPNFEEA